MRQTLPLSVAFLPSCGEDVLAAGDRILLFTDGLTEMPSAPESEDDERIAATHQGSDFERSPVLD
jgi:hypothetical protein